MNVQNTKSNAIDDDKPLDPAVERVRKKMMRLMGISVAIMMIGLMAVIGAIFYKISSSSKKKIIAKPVSLMPSPAIDLAKDIIGEIKLPSGSRIVKAELSGGRILLSIEYGEGELALWVYDLSANRIFAKIAVKR